MGAPLCPPWRRPLPNSRRSGSGRPPGAAVASEAQPAQTEPPAATGLPEHLAGAEGDDIYGIPRSEWLQLQVMGALWAELVWCCRLSRQAGDNATS